MHDETTGTSSASVRTTAVTVLSSDHGRMRRAERLIAKRDLQAAKKNAVPEESFNQRGELRLKYTFADVVYITDATGTREITSWAVPGAGLDVQMKAITQTMKNEHAANVRRSLVVSNWTSHTVVVVDQSGSMRKTDVSGGATRSDAVWLTLALDYIAKRIESGEAAPMDVISVVVLGQESSLVIDRKPTDWVLFNDVISLLRSQEPFFDGNYLPALDMAEHLLLDNSNGSCALTLFFLSDGKPSDRMQKERTGIPIDIMTRFESMVAARVDSLACRFGRRLTVRTVGFGSPDEDFRILKKMASRSAQFGCNSDFHPATLSAESLGSAFASLSTSLTMTKMELTDSGSMQRVVRDVRREARDTIDELQLSINWLHYPKIVSRVIWDWQTKTWVQVSFHDAAACGAALRTHYFGEGAERLVRKFREVSSSGCFVGPLLVAKEGRFQLDVQNADLIRFHRVFCATQSRARDLADIFNQRLSMLQERAGLAPNTARINFLESSVYVVDDVNLGRVGVLVEKQLDNSKYKKWNDNQGAVDGEPLPATLLESAQLGAIEESDEEGDGEGDEEVKEHVVSVAVDDVPQAFSHFTYSHTNRRVLVCDLQGVLTDGTAPLFEFTDPVIHYNSHTGRRNVFGRTDRGKRGISDFFKSHKCSELCRMLKRQWVRTEQCEQDEEIALAD